MGSPLGIFFAKDGCNIAENSPICVVSICQLTKNLIRIGNIVLRFKDFYVRIGRRAALKSPLFGGEC
jgi:hypothetical protein